MKKRMWCLLICILLFLGGCLEVEPFLQPPRPQGQQQAVQEALSAALSAEAGDSYILKYPAGGNFSAFLMLDENGNTVSPDQAVKAVAFYAAAAGERTHIRLLQREADGWRSVTAVRGEAADLHKVSVADLDGDGKKELLVGWNLYSNSYQLSIYQPCNRLEKTADAGRYTAYFVGDMNADGNEEFLLLHIGNTVTASLRRWNAKGVTVMGDANLPGDIRSFEKLLYGKLSNGEDGLYVDALLSNGNYTTELLYWDGSRLVAPLHTAGTAHIADRTPYVAVTDVDGNAVPEIPVTAAPKGDARGQVLADWYSWDVTARAAVRQFSGVVNTVDGYCIEVEDAWLSSLSVRYDEETRTLWLQTVDADGETTPFLIIQNTADGKQKVEGYAFESLPGNLSLEIWYETDAPYRLTMEKISYMLVAL